MPLDLSRIQVLCFDVDGTLSDTDDLYVARVGAVLRRLRLARDPFRAARRLVMWIESPANFLMGLADRFAVDDELIGLLNWIYRHTRGASRPLPSIPGVIDLLRDLARRYPMAVVSARDERATLEYLERADIRRHFSAIVTALSASRTKPFPDPVRLAAAQLGVSPEACLMIGDTTVDIRAGRLAGAQTVGVLCGFGERQELLRQGADLILPTTADLRSILLPT